MAFCAENLQQKRKNGNLFTECLQNRGISNFVLNWVGYSLSQTFGLTAPSEREP